MKKMIFAALLFLLCVLLTGCQTEQQTIVSTSTLQIITEGRKTTVCDLESGSEYHFTRTRAKAAEARKTPYTAVDTDTMKIVLNGNDVSITEKKTGSTYILMRKKGKKHV